MSSSTSRRIPRPQNRPNTNIRAKMRPISDPSPIFQEDTKEAELPLHLIKQARDTGQLSLANKGLSSVPSRVWSINELTSAERKTISVNLEDSPDKKWWENAELKKLILANNTITSIPPDIEKLVGLQVLDLHDNHLSTLPSTFEDLKFLTKLDLSHNKFTELPEAIFQLRELQILNAAHNMVPVLSDDISNLSFLQELDLSNNQLTKLPKMVGYLTRLTKLNISNNQLTSLPDEIGDLHNLQMFDATHNEIPDFPKTCSSLIHLEQLYLRHNKIAKLPVLEHCQLLKELHIGNNELEELTKEHLERMPALRVLDLRDNRLTSLPDEINIVQGLERLDLSNNDLLNLPLTLGIMPQLKSLLIDGNPLKGIRRDIVQRGTVQLLKYLRSRIDDPKLLGNSPRSNGGDFLGYCPSPAIEKYTLKATKTLEYSSRQAQSIPDDIMQMAAEAEVNIVKLNKNAFTMLPENLSLLTKDITELDLGFNRLSIIQPFLGESPRLVYIDFRNNQLEDLPESFSSLLSLREINLACNRLKKLPQSLYNLPSLEIILACGNQINTIEPEGLITLKMLATLDLSNNDIMNVPPELGNVTQLRSLLLEGNPFRTPRPATLEKGTYSILEYLRSRILV